MAEREPVPGDILGGRYEVLGELGRGGMATVYRGRDVRLQRRVAIKVFRDGFAEAVDPRRIEQEMQLLAGVDHPSVVSVLDASTGDGRFGAFLVMELVNGDDLGALLHRARGPLAADFARRIVADVAGALHALHLQGVVHRDVKPANILVPVGAASPVAPVAAKLVDFGIAQLVDGARITGPESVLGTAAYLSPEQVRGTAVRPASDVYSLGLVLLEALTGQRAFPGPATESAMARLHRPPDLPPNASPALADLLSRMTALDPEHRPRADEVKAKLRDQLTGVAAGSGPVRITATPATGTSTAGYALAAGPTASTGSARPVPVYTPAAGFSTAEPTAAHEPAWTAGTLLGTTGTPVTGGLRTATGSRPVAGARRRSRRAPAILAVAATALAGAVAAVAIVAASGVDVPPSTGTEERGVVVGDPNPEAATDDVGSTAVPGAPRPVATSEEDAEPTGSRAPAASPTPSAVPSSAAPTPRVPRPVPSPTPKPKPKPTRPPLFQPGDPADPTPEPEPTTPPATPSTVPTEPPDGDIAGEAAPATPATLTTGAAGAV